MWEATISHKFESRKQLARSDSPYGPVIRSRNDGFAIGADGHAVHVTRVSVQRALALARGHVPHAMPCGRVSEAKLV